MSEDLIDQLKAAVLAADADAATSATSELLADGIAPSVILESALSQAMLDLGEQWKLGNVFLPEVAAAAEVFTLCTEIVEPALLADANHRVGVRVMIATVDGDLHDLGKNMVVAMLKMAGFDVVDLGTDVSSDDIVEAVRRDSPAVLGLSALLTTTLPEQRKVIEALTRAGLRDQVAVLVGGAAATEEWATAIGADGYGQHAPDAVRLVRELTGAPAS